MQYYNRSLAIFEKLNNKVTVLHTIHASNKQELIKIHHHKYKYLLWLLVLPLKKCSHVNPKRSDRLIPKLVNSVYAILALYVQNCIKRL